MAPRRDPVHLGSGEPVLLLHPFVLSQYVWQDVAGRIADTGRYEVFAPTLAGHNGGPNSGTIFLDTNTLADHVETQLDELGWETAHIVGNSLGGWVAFELERRGRARSVTAIAPGGGWTRWTPGKFVVVLKFLIGMPLWLLAKFFGAGALKIPYARQISSLPLAGHPSGVTDADWLEIIDDVAHSPAYLQLLVKTVAGPGLAELADTYAPVQMVICGKDRIFPPKRYSAYFRDGLPGTTEFHTLDECGHVPMLEAPQRVTDIVVAFLDDQARRDVEPDSATA